MAIALVIAGAMIYSAAFVVNTGSKDKMFSVAQKDSFLLILFGLLIYIIELFIK